MLDPSNVAEHLLGAVFLLCVEDLACMLKYSSKARDMLGHGGYLPASVNKNIGLFVQRRRQRCPNGRDTQNAGGNT